MDRRLLTLELSSEELSRADEILQHQPVSAERTSVSAGTVATVEQAALHTELTETLASICEEPQPVITTVSVSMHKKLAIISALRNQRTGRLLLPSDCIYMILLFMRTPVRRRIRVV